MTSDLLRVPITVARFGDRLATVHGGSIGCKREEVLKVTLGSGWIGIMLLTVADSSVTGAAP